MLGDEQAPRGATVIPDFGAFLKRLDTD
jgi:hypothetical protein